MLDYRERTEHHGDREAKRRLIDHIISARQLYTRVKCEKFTQNQNNLRGTIK